MECRSLQGRDPKKRSFLRANAAQQRHNVGFVPANGQFEGGRAVTAGRRVSGPKTSLKLRLGVPLSQKRGEMCRTLMSLAAAAATQHTQHTQTVDLFSTYKH